MHVEKIPTSQITQIIFSSHQPPIAHLCLLALHLTKTQVSLGVE